MNHRPLLACLAALTLLALPGAVAAETWTKVALVDGMCAKKAKDVPDAHTRDCAIKCASGGYGIFTAEGRYLKFDEHGSEQALAALKASDRKDHLRVDVKGTLEGDRIAVDSVALAR